MVQITLCPNCRSMQKVGVYCPLCGCPVEKPSSEIDKNGKSVRKLRIPVALPPLPPLPPAA